MNWKNRLTNYNFWISIISAVLLILQAFKFEFDVMYINEIATAVLGLLVVIGIISDPTKVAIKQNKKEEKQEEIVVNKNLVVSEFSNSEVVKEQEKTVEAIEENETEKTSIPSDEQVETDDDNNENDFKDIVNKISVDLSNETEKFKNFSEILINFLKNSNFDAENIKNLENFSQNNVIENDSQNLTETEIKEESDVVESKVKEITQPENEEETQKNFFNIVN